MLSAVRSGAQSGTGLAPSCGMVTVLRLVGTAPARLRRDHASFSLGASPSIAEPDGATQVQTAPDPLPAPLPTNTLSARKPSRYPVWCPSVAIHYGLEGLIIQAELDGVRTEELTVEIYDDAVVLLGDWTREGACGSFCRRIALPTAADPDRVAAVLADRVLTIVAPAAASDRVPERR